MIALQETQLLKSEDDTTVISFNEDSDESAYRREAEQLTLDQNNLELNTLKTVEMIVDSRRSPPTLPPLYSEEHCVCCGDLPVSGIHNIPGSKMGIQHRHNQEKGPAEDVLPAPAQEVQPA